MDFAIPGPTTDASVGDAAETAKDDERYQIGEVARRASVTQRAVRYYEQRGLLEPAGRGRGGRRLYSRGDIERVVLIRQLQSLLNLSLAEIGEVFEAEALLAQVLVTVRSDRELATCKSSLARNREALIRQTEIVERKLEQLREMQFVIDRRLGIVDRHEREIEAIRRRPVTD